MELTAIVQVGLAMMFLSASVAKLRRPDVFRRALADYVALPGPLPRLASGVIAAEAALGTALIADWSPRTALRLSAALLLVFACVAGANVAERRKTDCGCLGNVVSLRLGWGAVSMNVAIAAATILVSFGTRHAAIWSGRLDASGHLVVWTIAPLLVLTYWTALYAFSVAALVQAPLAKEDGA